MKYTLFAWIGIVSVTMPSTLMPDWNTGSMAEFFLISSTSSRVRSAGAPALSHSVYGSFCWKPIMWTFTSYSPAGR